MPLQIRPAAADEVLVVAKLYHDVWHLTQASLQDRAIARLRDMDWFERRIKSLASRPLLALLNGRPVGFTAWSCDHLGQLFVTPEEQGQGIGRGLLMGAEIRMREEGVHLAKLLCLVGNGRARRFYEQNGWTLKTLESMPTESMDGAKQVAHWVMTKQL
jgi:GNAT superfamily N-acetyltransferase